VELLERDHVHEHETGVVAVEELHFTLVDGGRLDLDPGIESLLDDFSREHVLEFRADECGTLARIDVLEPHDGPQVSVEVQDKPVLQVVRRHHSLESTSDSEFFRPAGTPDESYDFTASAPTARHDRIPARRNDGNLIHHDP
jgi:hypothetical protein